MNGWMGYENNALSRADITSSLYILIGQLTYFMMLNADWSKITMQGSQGYMHAAWHPNIFKTMKCNIYAFPVTLSHLLTLQIEKVI